MIDFFIPNQIIKLPDLSEYLHISSDNFVVRQKFDGGMGTCYRIEDIVGKSYALKVIHSDLIPDDKSVSRYKEELKLWLTFSACEGIAEALYITNINGIPCIVSTWMNGGDMRKIIKETNPYVFYHSMDRIISSLKWVNDRYNVIHRDLKPGNILIDEDKNAFIADWGLAKLIANNSNNKNFLTPKLAEINPSLTQHGAFVGTALYASPEQLLGLADIDFRSDIYSLGCIMYQWETGNPPFIANTIKGIASGHLYSKPHKLGGFFKSTNFKAENIIMKCLEKDPSNRYQTYDELLYDLRKKGSKVVESFTPYIVKERYYPVNIGYDDFTQKLKYGHLGIVDKKGIGLVSEEDITPYLKKAFALSSLGEHDKAIAIYQRLYIPKMVEEIPDFGYHQMITINLANELNSIGKSEQALSIISTISKAKSKPATYYVNLSNIYIHLKDFMKCTTTCEEGVTLFPNDLDLIGNLTIGLTEVGRLDEAIKFAEKRLSLERNVHSLYEAANLMFKYGEMLKNTNFPEAIEFYKKALSLNREAVSINPLFTTALYNISLLYYKLRRYSDSMAMGAEISKIEKGTTAVNAFYAARNMLWTNKFKEALNFCNTWTKLYPNSILLKRIKSEILVDGFVVGNYNKDGLPIIEKYSFEFFTNIISDKEDRVATDIIFLAKIHFWMNEQQEIEYGMQLLEWGKKLYPQNWKFNFYLSAYALNYKRPQKALQEALECQRKAPWREKVYSLLTRAYSANGQEVQSSKMRLEYERIKSQKEKLYASCRTL